MFLSVPNPSALAEKLANETRKCTKGITDVVLVQAYWWHCVGVGQRLLDASGAQCDIGLSDVGTDHVFRGRRRRSARRSMAPVVSQS